MAPTDMWEPQAPDQSNWLSQPPRPPSAPLCSRAARGASIEDQIRQAYYTPAPTAYNPKQPDRFTALGGRFSTSKAPSVLDADVKIHGYVPGPGSYETRNLEGHDLPGGGRIGREAPHDRVTISGIFPPPGPQQYDPKDPAQPTVLYGNPFGKSKREPSHIKDAITATRGIPGPGEYDLERAYEFAAPFCPEGGRSLMASKPESYFDAAAKITTANPPPDSYMLPGTVGKKPNSEAVFRHESATYGESKALVDGILNLKMVTPGPGAYDIPDGASIRPIAGVPALKSGKLGHGMPHPYSYNCQVDLSSKFVPHRQRNSSSSQIYEGKSNQKLSRPSSTPNLLEEASVVPSRAEVRAKRRQESLIPGSTRSRATADPEQEPDPEQQPSFDESMQRPASRRGGGMGRRSHSAGSMLASVASVDHPSVKEAITHYPKLAGRKGRASQHFLPMASRRQEAIGTKDVSHHYQRYHYTRKQMEELGEVTHDLSKTALEPLDCEKLLKESVKILEQKARAQLRVEGLSRERRTRVLEEMDDLFHPPSQKFQGNAPEASQPENATFYEEDEYGQYGEEDEDY